MIMSYIVTKSTLLTAQDLSHVPRTNTFHSRLIIRLKDFSLCINMEHIQHHRSQNRVDLPRQCSSRSCLWSGANIHSWLGPGVLELESNQAKLYTITDTHQPANRISPAWVTTRNVWLEMWSVISLSIIIQFNKVKFELQLTTYIKHCVAWYYPHTFHHVTQQQTRRVDWAMRGG